MTRCVQHLDLNFSQFENLPVFGKVTASKPGSPFGPYTMVAPVSRARSI